MRLLMRYFSILFQSQMQYKASFYLLTFGQFFVPFSVFAGLYFLFQRFGQIRGWSFYEVALCFAVIHMSFAISESFARGFDAFSSLVRNGNFDRILVRPRSTVLQVLGSNFEFSRVGRLIQSLLVLIWVVFHLSITWNILRVTTLILMVTSGVFIFAGIFILAATMCFWTVEAIEVANIFTDGGREMAQYPLNIYQKWVARFFTFVIPFASANYLPMQYLLGKESGSQGYLYMLSSLSGILFIVPCLGIWNLGVRHYRSTGS
jgi:ABC-2 type transport system permease protein